VFTLRFSTYIFKDRRDANCTAMDCRSIPATIPTTLLQRQPTVFSTKPTTTDAQQVLASLSAQGRNGKLERWDSRHSDGRSDLSLGVLVVPLTDECPDIDKAFTAITKDVGETGIGVVANRAIPSTQALLRLSGDSETRLLRTTIRNRKELGQGWVRFDMEVTGVLDKSEYPQLKHFVGAIMS
jgi:hypothetical protein